jgi:hypothetical protein
LLRSKAQSKFVAIVTLLAISVLFTNCSNYTEQMVFNGSSRTTLPDDSNLQTSGDLALGDIECPSRSPQVYPTPPTIRAQEVVYIGGECDIGTRSKAEYRVRIAVEPGGPVLDVACELGRFRAPVTLVGLAKRSYEVTVTLSALVGGQVSNDPPPLNVPCPISIN